MAQITMAEVRAALDTILHARQTAVEALQLRDPLDESKPFTFPPIPDAASNDDIQLLEDLLDQRLAPSYRHFLQICDGLPKFDIGSNLLSVGEVINTKTDYPRQGLEKMFQMIERDSLEGLLVIGTTQAGHPRFILDSTMQDSEGEWIVIEYGEREAFSEEYVNLLEFFKDVVETIRLTGEL